LEQGQRPQATGEPITERARIAGVEAGIAAGLVPSAEELTRPGSIESASGPANAKDALVLSGSEEQAASIASYDLPDWTDPPTLQVPRVFLDLEQEAAAERGGPPPPPPGGPVWRERQEDWEDTDAVLAQLASTGPSVTDYEESSSDDPFAYDFLDLDDESWFTRDDGLGPNKAEGRDAEASASVAGTESASSPPHASGASGSSQADSRPAPHDEVVAPSRAPRRRHVARHARSRLTKAPTAAGGADAAAGASAPAGAAAPAQADTARRGDKDTGSPRNPVVATLTGLALAALLLLCFLAGPPAVLAIAVVAVTVAAAEFFHALGLAGYRPATLLGLLGVPGVIIAAYFCGPGAVLLGFVIFLVSTMLWYLVGITRRSPLANLSVTVFAFGWTGVLGAFAGLLVDPRIFPDRHGIAFVLGAAIAAVGYDVGGYVIGSRFGRHNLVPSVSPHKTWEGLIGGCAVAIAASAAITSRIYPWHLGTALVLGLIVAVVAPCGDLVESMIKRDLGVKDMGSLLPGHGGVLDRIDALLFVLPAAYYFVLLAHIG